MDVRLDCTAKLPGGNATGCVKFIDLRAAISRDIVTRPAPKNAGVPRVGAAAQHLSAIAHECGWRLDGGDRAESGKRTARSTGLQPIGRYIAKDVPEDTLGAKRNKDQLVVHPGERLSPAMGGVVGHCGNLAQQCAIVKVVGMADLKSPDSARRFDGEEARFEVVKNKRYREGEVLVIHDEGPQHGPGMRVSSRPAQSRIGEGRAERSLSLSRWRNVQQVSRAHTGAGTHSSTARKVCHAGS
jgi:dihydroxy-acid dehydratase